ncbi:MAG TPA: RHS repeat-associated core domain-containing protein [Candidatus Acidoferrales bacterium]|nr:RHS repeat-associated core domain-containing protein [Candidatus Acidoferrales bacterium]
MSGYSYDASGDELGDGTNTFAWDAEKRMTTSAGVSYTFDGNFERVMDTSPKLYWYGLDGSVLAQTDGSGNPVNEYIYFDGMRIARRDSSGNVYYSFGNELGSPTITNSSGSLCYDADFFPFGGERAYTSTCAPNQKFAGMEQDSATGLYRTIFRQYAANNGRWLSPDPYRGSYDLTNRGC